MRRFAAMATIAVTALAGLPTNLFAQSPVVTASLERSAAVETMLNSTFSAYPKGGAALSARIADLVVADPSLIAGLAAYLKAEHGLNEAQKQAARDGLVHALVRLNAYGQEITPPPGISPGMMVITLGALGGVGVLVGVVASKKSDPVPAKASDN